MKKSPSEMTNAELRQYLSEHRNEEAIFSEALEVLLSRKKDSFKYPAPQTMSRNRALCDYYRKS
ncbi:MAG: hypothetical protein GPJ04_23800 [Microcystis aeruginosa G13-03]|nr:hypothetical protein [Microcystis aeruginosa G13-03]